MNGNGGLTPQDQLTNFRAVTDSKLGRLDVEDLLIELLERVRSILDADTAAVLLLDKDSGDLVPRRLAASKRRSAKASVFRPVWALPDVSLGQKSRFGWIGSIRPR